MEYIVGALIMWWLVSFIEEETHICGVLEFPMLITQIVLAIVSFPFICVYKIFFRHTIKPVTYEQVTKANILKDSKHLFDDLYICFDKDAKKFWNKVFLFRVKPVVFNNTPSSPEGEFRFGEERSSPFYFARAFCFYPGDRQILAHCIISHRVRQVKTQIKFHYALRRIRLPGPSNFGPCQISIATAKPATSAASQVFI